MHIAVIGGPSVSTWMEAGLLFAAGFFGGQQILTFAMVKEGQVNRLTGTVVAFVNMIGIAGAMIFQPLVGYLADLSSGDFRLALTVAPLCAALAAVFVLFLHEQRLPEHQSGPTGRCELSRCDEHRDRGRGRHRRDSTSSALILRFHARFRDFLRPLIADGEMAAPFPRMQSFPVSPKVHFAHCSPGGIVGIFSPGLFNGYANTFQ